MGRRSRILAQYSRPKQSPTIASRVVDLIIFVEPRSRGWKDQSLNLVVVRNAWDEKRGMQSRVQGHTEDSNGTLERHSTVVSIENVNERLRLQIWPTAAYLRRLIFAADSMLSEAEM